MAIGGQQDKNTENDALLTVARSIYHAMLLIDQHTDSVGGLSSAQFQAAPFNFPQAEADDVVAVLADWTQLLAIFRGQQTLAATKNFRTNTKKLLGQGFY